MAGQSNAAPVIIKRKKIIQGGGHHGGAWKVAYADFVTAMMAFFMLMWLLNATTEKQRKGIADYFNPAIPIVRISGGGSGAFGGDSVFSEQQLAQSGTGASSDKPSEQNKARGAAVGDGDGAGEMAALKEIEKTLLARGGESMTMETMLRHVVTRVTDEGLVIEIFDLADAPLFAEGSVTPETVTQDIAQMLAEVLVLTKNQIAVSGHVRSYPITLIANPAWDLSADRAQAMRGLIEQAGLGGGRMQRVSGYSDRIAVTPNPTDPRNNRLEVILLRKDR